ncbi:MAG: VOC family protein, partial [Actinomycetota bacterium]|nr:VOC family protein [Actinomycetota bacterium]
MAPIGRLRVVALDCRDPRALAGFYSAITGCGIEDDDHGWVQLGTDSDVAIAFQLAADHEPPVWPGGERPQQVHLDFDVDDLDAAEN